MSRLADLVPVAETAGMTYAPRCVGGCGVEVPRRGAWCSVCGKRDLADIRKTELAPAYATLPDWPWARFTNAAFVERIERGGSGPMLTIAREWKAVQRDPSKPTGSVTFVGRTGIGKTSLLVALAHHILDMASEHQLSERAMALACGIRFVFAADLAEAARRWPPRDADNPPLVQGALDASILILDDLGHEDPRDRSVFKVLDTRMRSRDKPTLTTSRLTRGEMSAPDRYGDDGARRIFDCGAVVVDLSPLPRRGAS